MYRDFRRASRKVSDSDLRANLRIQILSEFKSHQNKEDAAAIKGLLGEGMRTLTKLRSLSEVVEQVYPDVSQSCDKEANEQGRVGTGWPWSR